MKVQRIIVHMVMVEAFASGSLADCAGFDEVVIDG